MEIYYRVNVSTTRLEQNYVAGKPPSLSSVCFCFPFPFFPLVVVGSGSKSGGGEDWVEDPCPQADCVGCASPKIFLSDLFPEINSLGGFFDAAVGSSGNAELDNGGGAGILPSWGLISGMGC